MANKRYTKEKIPSLFAQKVALLASYPFSFCSVEKDTLTWNAKIRPSSLSRAYNVLVTYSPPAAPDVWIIGDALQKLDDPHFPHNYFVDQEKKMVQVCLYRYFEFSKTKYLANTIVPWIVEWLFYYEIWLATGEWCGGGEHPIPGKPKKIQTSIQRKNYR